MSEDPASVASVAKPWWLAPVERGAFVLFVASLAGAWGSIEAYMGAGGGAAGAAGIALLIAPFAALAIFLLIHRFRGFVRGRAGFVACGLALPFLVFSCSFPEYARRERFDSAAWKGSAGCRSPRRIRQVDHLLASHVLDHASEARVAELLGPDDTGRGTGCGTERRFDRELRYYLGPERGFISIDSEWLVIRFDAAGKVVELTDRTD